MKARVDGNEVFVGKLSFLEENGIEIDKEQKNKTEELSGKGYTVIAAGISGRLVGIFALADAVKEDAGKTVEELKDKDVEPIMITGDNRRTAEAIAEQTGIEQIQAEVMPGEKAGKIREIQGRNGKVAMVGDGINDAPALMQADVGVAIGTGTDIAIDSSDVIITGGRVEKITDSRKIAEKSYGKTKQNLILAFLFNGVGIPAASTGLLHPVWAMVAMATSVSTILLNSFGGKIIPQKRKLTQEQKTFKALVPGMTCEGCKKAVLTNLKHKKGVFNPKVDLSSKKVSFDYSSKSDVKKIEEKLRESYGEIYIEKKG